MYQVSKIDEAGLFVEPVIVDSVKNLPPNLIVPHAGEGLYWPKWDGSEWVEGRSPEEIDAIKSKESASPNDPKSQEIAELKAAVAELSTAVSQFQSKP